MLKRLLEFGLINGYKAEGKEFKPYFTIKMLKDLEKSCCLESTTEAIDYDNTKILVSQEFGFNSPKSCDALKIMPEINRLDFIELKSLENMKRNIKSCEQIKEQVKKFDLETKIEDSYFILQCLIKSDKFKTTKSEIQTFKNTEKNYFIVVDKDIEENGIKNFALTLGYLAGRIDDTIALEFSKEVDNMESKFSFLTNKPKIVNSKEIDNYYKKLNSL